MYFHSYKPLYLHVIMKRQSNKYYAFKEENKKGNSNLPKSGVRYALWFLKSAFFFFFSHLTGPWSSKEEKVPTTARHSARRPSQTRPRQSCTRFRSELPADHYWKACPITQPQDTANPSPERRARWRSFSTPGSLAAGSQGLSMCVMVPKHFPDVLTS